MILISFISPEDGALISQISSRDGSSLQNIIDACFQAVLI